MQSNNIARVLNFWFGKKGSPDYLKPKSFWYGSKEDDEIVRKNLAEDFQYAKTGKLDSWSDESEGAIALILLLDQVPRNIFRDTPQAYATDAKALDIANKVVEKGWDKNQPAIVRRYIYSPFNHSESIDDQKRSVVLFKQLGDPNHLYWAEKFYNTIKEHGRFPHRDKILNRKPN